VPLLRVLLPLVPADSHFLRPDVDLLERDQLAAAQAASPASSTIASTIGPALGALDQALPLLEVVEPDLVFAAARPARV
jgi:hypothetical protein